jgi:hypothetical protein
MRSSIAVAVLFLVSVACLPQDLQIDAATHWDAGTLTLEIRAPLQNATTLLPNARSAARRRIDEAAPQLLRETLAPIVVDSRTTVAQAMRRRPELFHVIGGLWDSATAEHSRLNRSLSEYVMHHTVRLFPDVAALFIAHEAGYAPPRVLEWEPTIRFTGLVIYAKGEYPVHGEDRMDQLQPALFPRLYDERTNLILEKEMMDPSTVLSHGLVAYTDGLDESPFRERIGPNPLRTVAAGLFGSYPTDILIPSDAARKLLVLEENRRILREGRILVICDLTDATIRQDERPVP